MNAESEVQVLVDTGQFKNLLAERDRLRLANARLVEEKNQAEMRLARLGQAVERHASGLLGELGKTSEDIMRWYLKQVEKMQRELK